MGQICKVKDKSIMTEKDKKLIEEARKLKIDDEYLIDGMMAQADTEKARKVLNGIGSVLYHRGEGRYI